jgi:hypothetical protein
MNLIMSLRLALVVGLAMAAAIMEQQVMAGANVPQRDVRALFSAAESEGRIGIARKTKLVDARPARSGEVIITVIAGEGEETRSKPAAPDDWVVRNRCLATDNEEYLVKAANFAARYEGPLSNPDPDGWRTFRPRGPDMRYFVVGEESFRFTAPWGEPMIARRGDRIVQDPQNPADTYRVAAAAFDCTYEILALP